jgi:hypothetical protein
MSSLLISEISLRAPLLPWSDAHAHIWGKSA